MHSIRGQRLEAGRQTSSRSTRTARCPRPIALPRACYLVLTQSMARDITLHDIYSYVLSTDWSADSALLWRLGMVVAAGTVCSCLSGSLLSSDGSSNGTCNSRYWELPVKRGVNSWPRIQCDFADPRRETCDGSRWDTALVVNPRSSTESSTEMQESRVRA